MKDGVNLAAVRGVEHEIGAPRHCRPPRHSHLVFCSCPQLSLPEKHRPIRRACADTSEKGQRMGAASAARLPGSEAGRLADGRTRSRSGSPYRTFPLHAGSDHHQTSPRPVPFGQNRGVDLGLSDARSGVGPSRRRPGLQQVQAKRRSHTPTRPPTQARRASLGVRD